MTTKEKTEFKKELRKKFDKELEVKIFNARCVACIITSISIVLSQIMLKYVLPQPPI
ncbi:hypothetical protein TDCHD05_10459 [Tenacibaculum dicentrarchi]|nr:hypothetical protein TDCHD05_10459 [Tenacibaculum dicentrarchi]